MDIETYDIDDLQKRFSDELPGVDRNAWVDKWLAGVRAILNKDPLRYLSYGPYWWLVKQAMIDHGIEDFGDTVDAEWFERVNYGDEALNIMAAQTHDDNQYANHSTYNSSHALFDIDEGETIEYVLTDSEIEAMIPEKIVQPTRIEINE